jgi:hypothetical protein
MPASWHVQEENEQPWHVDQSQRFLYVLALKERLSIHIPQARKRRQGRFVISNAKSSINGQK